MAATALAHAVPARWGGPRLLPPDTRTLAEVVDLAWTALQAEAPAACPICDGRMEVRHAAAGVAGGRCKDCGTEIS
jgi:hypothetical protein